MLKKLLQWDGGIKIGRLGIEFTQQWSYFFTGANWYDFTVIHIEFENESNMGMLRASFALLGLFMDLRWDLGPTPMRDELQARWNDFNTNKESE